MSRERAMRTGGQLRPEASSQKTPVTLEKMSDIPPARRLFRFYSVGLLGVGVQLALLFLLTRLGGVHYLPATLLAVESAILHNFFWHAGWTFRRRIEPASGLLVRLWRFNIVSGATALLGNLVIMALLVEGLSIPVLPANLAAIAGCSLINFLASDWWAFRREPASGPSGDGERPCL